VPYNVTVGAYWLYQVVVNAFDGCFFPGVEVSLYDVFDKGYGVLLPGDELL
jgi:hypothetical protein